MRGGHDHGYQRSSAGHHWELTEQLFNETLVVTTRRLTEKRVIAQGTAFVLHNVKPERLFGLKTLWRGSVKVNISVLVWSKISNALKRLGFRSRNFLAQLVSETSRACTIRVRRSSLGRLWNALGAAARLCHRNSLENHCACAWLG